MKSGPEIRLNSYENLNQMNKRLAILLTVHNRKNKTLKCLENVYHQLPLDFWEVDIFLTNDGCTDGTPEAIRKKYPNVQIIEGDGNLYWNKGMIKSWKAAVASFDYDAYLWLNDDTLLYPKAINSLISSYELSPDSIIVGTTVSEIYKNTTYGGRINGKLLHPSDRLIACDTFNGNIVLIPRSVYHKIGFLDAKYTHSLGDIDYGMTAAEKGIKSYVAPDYVGICENNPLPPKWMRPDIPINDRLKNLFSPLGYTNPPEYYHFKRKHWSHLHAILAMISIALHFVAPNLWCKIRRLPDNPS